eukprot:7184558-Prymnesium_polylepis.1
MTRISPHRTKQLACHVSNLSPQHGERSCHWEPPTLAFPARPCRGDPRPVCARRLRAWSEADAERTRVWSVHVGQRLLRASPAGPRVPPAAAQGQGRAGG